MNADKDSNSMELLEDYISWISGKTTANELIEKHNWSCNKSMVIREFPYFSVSLIAAIIDVDEPLYDECSECGGNYTIKMAGKGLVKNIRKALKNTNDYNEVVSSYIANFSENIGCEDCGHAPYADQCGCGCFNEEVLSNAEKKLVEVTKQYQREELIDIDELSYRHKLLLLCILRGYADYDNQIIHPYGSEKSELSPVIESSFDSLKELFRAYIIYPHVPLSLDSFKLDEKADEYSFFLNTVHWKVLISQGGKLMELSDLIQELESILLNEKLQNKSSIVHIWGNLVIDEALQFIDYWANDYNLNFNENKNNRVVIEGLIDDFSIGQIYNMIFKVSKDVVAFLRSGNCNSRPHAINTFSGKLQSYADLIRSKDWDFKHYSRDNRVTRSILSEVLQEGILRLDDNQSFYSTPKAWLESNEIEKVNEGSEPYCLNCGGDAVNFEQSIEEILVHCTDCCITYKYTLTVNK